MKQLLRGSGIAITLAIACCAEPALSDSIGVNGVTRTFTAQLPDTKPAPLVIVLHGNTQTGAGCTAPPAGAAFYPFWTLGRISANLRSTGHGTCVWNFGNVLPRTFRTFGKDGEYGVPDVARYAGTDTSAGSCTTLSGVANHVFRQCAQRTERPAAPSAANSI